MSGETETFLRLIGKRSAGEVAFLLERYQPDWVTLVAQALVALAEHLDESAPTWRPIGSATESAEPKGCQPHKPELPRGDDIEEAPRFGASGLAVAALQSLSPPDKPELPRGDDLEEVL